MMYFGSTKYGLRWRVDVDAPWQVLWNGDKPNFVVISRDDMIKLWKKGFKLDEIHDFVAKRLDESVVCAIDQKFSEIGLL